MTRDEEDHPSRLLGEEAQRAFAEFIDRDYWSESDFLDAVSRYCPEFQIREEMLRKWYEWKPEPEDGEDPDLLEPGGDAELLEKLRRLFIARWADLLEKHDPLTRASALAARRSKWYKPWGIFNPDLWTSWILPGNDGYVIGRKGTGKTDFMCQIGQLLIAKKGTVLSCIPLEHHIEGYHYLTTATELLRKSCELMLAEKTCLVLLDEGFLYAAGESPLKDDVMAFRQFMRLFRKLGVASLLGSQRKSDILRDVRITAALRVQKKSRQFPDRAHVQIEGRVAHESPEFVAQGGVRYRVHDFSDYLKWIPRTSMPFRTEAIGSFVMDFDPVMLMSYLGRQPMEENQFDLAIKWLEGEGVYFTMQQRAYIAQRMKDEGVWTKKIASVFDVTERTIYRWLSKKVTPIWGTRDRKPQGDDGESEGGAGSPEP